MRRCEIPDDSDPAPPCRCRPSPEGRLCDEGSCSDGDGTGSLEQPIDEWPFLDQQVLVKSRSRSRSRKVCMTCQWFRHHSGVNCIPLLTCQLHQGLLAQGEHLVNRCQGWTDDMTRQRGWAPEAG